MKINQLSVFLENKPGQLKMASDLLSKAKINIQTLSMADAKQFGILRLVMRDWEQAKSVLERGGFVVKVTEVLAIEVDDRPGGLTDVLEPIEAAGLNVEYMYAFAFGRRGKAVLIFRFDQPDLAIEKLTAAGVNVVASVELFN